MFCAMILSIRTVFASSNPAEDDGFLIRSTPYFGGKVKSSVPRRKIYGMLRNPTSVKEILRRQNSSDVPS
jgi:hypothetical protein